MFGVAPLRSAVVARRDCIVSHSMLIWYLGEFIVDTHPVVMKRDECTVEMVNIDIGIIDKQISPILREWGRSFDANDLMSLARGCYLQGLLDGSNQQVVKQLEKLRQENNVDNPFIL